MKFLPSALLLGAALATPIEYVSPNAQDVKIIGITAIGSGCPVGHAFVNLDSTGTIFDVAFDEYIVEVGPGTPASSNRKNCRVSLNIEFPQGLQLSVVDSTFRGYASLARGQQGVCRAAYTFSGTAGQSVATKYINGPTETNYEMNQEVDIVTWSQCGDSTAILNVNSEVRVTPVNTPSKGSMTVDSFDGRLHLIFKAEWRRC